ncbi:uncharacterized protein LOC123005133 [Tribolium madens]|uniref:uncharacterized protein LOC123005133 n=1 Tax=Tribolium madens TaxID=41895 RepID=UPI001CF7560F|nr:uncharacterized protein LOC123005133 [Tribolium madens]
MAVLTKGEQQLLKYATFLGVLQGLTYAILSLICIILYHQENIDAHDIETYMDTVSYYLYMIFLNSQGDSKLFKNQTMSPEIFTIFAWIYFSLNLFWMGFSFDISQQNHQKIAQKAKNWGGITIIICLLDFITVVIFGADYGKCLSAANDNYYNKTQLQEVCANGFLPALVITAKGFTLWFVNAIFARKVLKLSKKLRQRQATVFVQPTPQTSPPVGFLTPQPVVQNPYIPQPQHPQNVNKNQFVYPNFHIPEPDYHHQQNLQPQMRRY